MADPIQFVREMFIRTGVSLADDDVWAVQGTPVVKHRALERLAGALNVQWHTPQVLIAKSDEAVILCSASITSRPEIEWSIGEAKVVPMVDSGNKNKWGKPVYEAAAGAIGNYQITPKQASYPFAMAEKRAKDRVILKLAGLQGVYSEEEADDFRKSAPEPVDDSIPIRAPATDAVTGGHILAAEEILEKAAWKGVDSLRAAWRGLSEPVRQELGGVAPDKFKRIAADVDSRRAA